MAARRGKRRLKAPSDLGGWEADGPLLALPEEGGSAGLGDEDASGGDDMTLPASRRLAKGKMRWCEFAHDDPELL